MFLLNDKTTLCRYDVVNKTFSNIYTLPSYGVNDLKINPYGKKIVLYNQTEKTIPIVEMNLSAAVEIDLTTYESTTIATNLLADKLCNVEYLPNNQVQIITTNYIAGTVPTGNLIRLADKNVYQNIVLSNQLVSTTSVIGFNNYLNGFVANNNVRYYKNHKKIL